MRSPFKLGTFLSLCLGAAMASCGSDDSTPAPSTDGTGGAAMCTPGTPGCPSGTGAAGMTGNP